MAKKQSGMITLEACVTVLMFLILMLLLSSLFTMFMAQNTTAHTVLQTSESLSLDVYAAERIGTGGAESTSEVVVSIGNFINGLLGRPDDNPSFTTRHKWYDGDASQVEEEVRKRFIGYLTGGDEDEADEFLKNLNVVEGLEGLDFSESYISGDTLYIVLQYKLQYDFNIWNVGKVDVKQTTCSKLWK